MICLKKSVKPPLVANRGFVLVTVLVIISIISIGTLNLMNFSGSQQKLVAINQIKILLRQESSKLTNEIVYFLNDEKSFLNRDKLWDHPCNQLPTTEAPIKQCVAFGENCTGLNPSNTQNIPLGCHSIQMTSGDQGSTYIYPKKSITWVYLNTVPVRGTMNEYHHLYRLDTTLVYDDMTVIMRSNVIVDRVGL